MEVLHRLQHQLCSHPLILELALGRRDLLLRSETFATAWGGGAATAAQCWHWSHSSQAASPWAHYGVGWSDAATSSTLPRTSDPGGNRPRASSNSARTASRAASLLRWFASKRSPHTARASIFAISRSFFASLNTSFSELESEDGGGAASLSTSVWGFASEDTGATTAAGAGSGPGMPYTTEVLCRVAA